MPHALDIDLLKTFIAIADYGSFTRAANEVHKTQSAVSMQMKRLEETIGRAVFVREGRQSRLTADGENLLDYARRIVKLSDDAVLSFACPELSGHVRMGTPDDYADRFLPEILVRFARTHPLIQVQVECRPSAELVELTRAGKLDIAMVTFGQGIADGEVIRKEHLVWVASTRHCLEGEKQVPLALPHAGCAWRNKALSALENAGMESRIVFSSPNSAAIAAAVTAGLAVSAIPQSTMKPGMKLLTVADGFPDLGSFDIGLLRSNDELPSAANAFADHIVDSLGNIGVRATPGPNSLVAAE